MDKDRFAIFLEKHIGLGIRWDTDRTYPFELSIAIMFVTINICFGKKR